MFSKLVTLVSICVPIAFATRCCQYHCSEAACIADTENNCKWLEEGVDDELITDGIQCRSAVWGDCGDCCPACPWNPPEFAVYCDNAIPCPAGAPSESDGVEPESPIDIVALIQEDEAVDCSTSSRNCLEEPGDFGIDYQYSPNTIIFEGVTYEESVDDDISACCYRYTSEYNDDITDCSGKSPTQSHIVLDIDCDEGDFEIVASSSVVSYGTDGSTCYNGIKIDTGCENTCDYQICIRYLTLAAGECPTTTSWVMDKAGNTFSFASLPDGIPSCNYEGARYLKHKLEKINDEDVLAVETNISKNYLKYSPAQISIFAMVIVALMGAWYYYGKNKKGEYKSLTEQTGQKSGYLAVA